MVRTPTPTMGRYYGIGIERRLHLHHRHRRRRRTKDVRTEEGWKVAGALSKSDTWSREGPHNTQHALDLVAHRRSIQRPLSDPIATLNVD